MALLGAQSVNLDQEGVVEEIPAVTTTSSLVGMLRLRPAVGRLLELADDLAASPRVAVLSYDYWQSQFGGSAEVLGRSLRVDDETHTIVGVLPDGLKFPPERAGAGLEPKPPAFWVSLRVQGEDREDRRARMFRAVGRLKPDATAATTRAQLSAVSQQLAVDFPASNRPWQFGLVSFCDRQLGRLRFGLPLLGIAVVAVMLLCCVNVSNLLLARGLSRQREFAVRRALGADRGRLIRDSLLESFVLAGVGGALGILLAQAGLHSIRTLAVGVVPFVHEAKLEATALGFVAGWSLLWALFFGLLPAVWQSRNTSPALHGHGTRATDGRQVQFWQRGLLIGQIAVVLLLLTAGALLGESFRRLMGQDLGYVADSVATIDLQTPGFATNGELCRTYRQLHERLKALPGVVAAGTISSIPLTGKWTFNERAEVIGQPVPEAERPILAATFVAFDYFQAMRIPFLEGRPFLASELKEDGDGQQVIINEAAARALFPSGSAVGRRLAMGSSPERALEIVGVVKDTRDVRLEEPPPPRLYWHYSFGGAQVVVRTSVPLRGLLPSLRDTVTETDRRLKITSLRPMNEIVSATVAERRFVLTLLLIYSLVALGIALVGIFGVVTFQVARRTGEFGIRLALGSTSGGLLRLILWEIGRVAVVGLVLGLGASFFTSQLLASQLFQLSPHDPLLLLAASTVLLGTVLSAGMLPARRAARVDPMVALRSE